MEDKLEELKKRQYEIYTDLHKKLVVIEKKIDELDRNKLYAITRILLKNKKITSSIARVLGCCLIIFAVGYNVNLIIETLMK